MTEQQRLTVPDVVAPAIAILPLPADQKDLVTRAARLVKTNPDAFADARQWLDAEYSEKAVAARKEKDWRRGKEQDMRELKDVIGAGEVRSRSNGQGYTVPTAWRDGPKGGPVFDKALARRIEREAKDISREDFAYIRRRRKDSIKEIQAELKGGPTADRIERLRSALEDLATEEFPADGARFAFARKVVFLAALCCWADGFPTMGELAEWKWTGRISIMDLLLDEGELPDSDPELGREQVLFPKMKHNISLTPDSEAGFDGAFADWLRKAVELLESEQANDANKGDMAEAAIQNQFSKALSIVYETGKKIESHPSTYAGRGETEIRDLFIAALSGHFQSVCGERTNCAGKTDIFIEEHGESVLIAECKVWAGSKGYIGAIDQLLSYLRWRDGRVAVLLFANTKEIGPVLEQIESATPSHPAFVRAQGSERPGWYNFELRRNNDSAQGVRLAVLCFHMP